MDLTEGSNLAIAKKVNAATKDITVGASQEVSRLDAPGHHTGQEEGRRNGKTFKVVDFAVDVGGDQSDGGVEAGETGKTARSEHEESDGVEGCAEAEGVRQGGGSDGE